MKFQEINIAFQKVFIKPSNHKEEKTLMGG